MTYKERLDAYHKVVRQLTAQIIEKTTERSKTHKATWDFVPIETIVHAAHLKTARAIDSSRGDVIDLEAIDEAVIDGIAYLAKVYQRVHDT